MTIKIHHIKFWIIVHGLLLFLIRPIVTSLHGSSNIIEYFDSDLYSLVCIYSGLSFAIFLLGLSLVKMKSPKLESYIALKSISIFRFTLIFSLWFVVWFIILFFKFKSFNAITLFLQSPSDYIHGSSIFILNSWTAMISFFIIKSYCLDVSNRSSLFIRIILLALGVASGLLSGSKSLALYPFFVILIYRSIKNKGIKLTSALVLITVVIFISGLLTFIRHYGIFSVVASGREIGTLSDFLFGFVDRFYGTDIIYSIIYTHLNLNAAYLLGSSLITIIPAFVPSFIWPDKPIISFGKVVSETYLPQSFQGLGISAAPTVIGELFANYSWFSLVLIFIFGFIFATHLKRIYSKIERQDSFYFTYYLISFTTLAFTLEASIVGWVMQLLMLYLLSNVFHRLMTTKLHVGQLI